MTTSKNPKKPVGKPTIYGVAMKRFQVVLDEETEQGMKSLDAGNLSGGIRVAWSKIKPSKKSKT